MNPPSTLSFPGDAHRLRRGDPRAGVPVSRVAFEPRRRTPAQQLLGHVERIAVFRALMLGDMLCTTPALRALRRGFPDAEITLIGLPWARALARRLPCVDRFIEFPGMPGLPELPCDVRQLPDFLAQVQAQRFGLALQMHGSGELTNPLVACFGAENTGGFYAERSWHPEADASFFVPWPEQGHEIERMLALTDGLGLPRQGLQLDFPVTAADRTALSELWPGWTSPRPYVCLHAGAQLPSRRWPYERFAQVADRLAATGRTVVLTGGAPEADLAHALESHMATRPVNLVGRTDLWTLGALVERAECVVCNDTGISHVAAALRRPSVVISSGADVRRWAPLDDQRHVVLWQDKPCRPCGHAVCPQPHSCAEGVSVDAVMHALQALLGGARPGTAEGRTGTAALHASRPALGTAHA